MQTIEILYFKIKKSAKNVAKSVNSVDKVFGLEELIFSFLDIHELIPLERVSKQFQLCADYWFRQQKILSFNDNYCGIYDFMPDIDLPNIEYLGIGHLETDYQTLYDILGAFQSIKWLEICDIKNFTVQEFRQLGQLLSKRVAKLNSLRIGSEYMVTIDTQLATNLLESNAKQLQYLYLESVELNEEALELVIDNMALKGFIYSLPNTTNQWQCLRKVAQKQSNLEFLGLYNQDFRDCDYNTKSMQFSKVNTLYLRYCELEEHAFVSLLKCFPSIMLANIKRYFTSKKSAKNEAKSVDSVDKVFGLEELAINIFSYLTINELIGLERVSKQFQFCANYWLRQQKSIAFNEKFCGMDYNKPNIDVIHNSYTFPKQYLKTNSDGKQSLIKNKKRIILLSKKLPNIEYLGIGHFDTDYKTLCKVLNAFQSIKWLEMCGLCDFKDQELRLLGQLLSGRITKLLGFRIVWKVIQINGNVWKEWPKNKQYLNIWLSVDNISVITSTRKMGYNSQKPEEMVHNLCSKQYRIS
ncbi:unnamed protein product [Medioppia subpectinata]|uniref:F-box domain-containing protein n=1 Tax=Medioppia subpectinata TaxID=1979941 RepID=A0A7R9PVD8_9ACAR|nr:unnamed protein product [Medioppia subpectinata]CAG2101723.1 unnamed protein product [Medioppia subpectinata]